MKVFLTGGTGFIGQPLVRSLLNRGWEVCALVRQTASPQTRSLEKLGVQCVKGDITDRESMRSGMTGADLVIHNAAWFELGISRAARELMNTINVDGTENVLSLALELGIPRTVYVSSVSYFGISGKQPQDETYRRQFPFTSFYEQCKAAAHEVALRYQERGLPLVMVCPAHVVGANDHSAYGYYQRLYVNRLMPPIAWAPDTVHSPAHVNDVAEGIALAAEKGSVGETYILAGEPTSMRQLFKIWATKPGGFKVKSFIPIWLAKLMFVTVEPVQRWLGLPAFISREVVNSMKGSFSFSSAKAQRELGWTHRPAHELWSSILDDEQDFLARRSKRDLISRLKPVDEIE